MFVACRVSPEDRGKITAAGRLGVIGYVGSRLLIVANAIHTIAFPRLATLPQLTLIGQSLKGSELTGLIFMRLYNSPLQSRSA